MYFRYYLPLERSGVLHFNEYKSSRENALCQVWLKLAQWFWRKRFLIFTPLLLSPLGKAHGPLFEKLESPSP